MRNIEIYIGKRICIVRKSLVLICFLFLFNSVFSEEIKFHHIGVNEGLANGRVDCIIQDHKGYLWFGTKRGLCRYNGKNFSTYLADPQDTLSLRYSQVTCLFEDSDSLLWVGVWGGGIHVYNRKDDNFLRIIDMGPEKNDLINLTISKIYEDQDNNIWVGTTNALFKYDKKKKSFKRYTLSLKNKNYTNSVTDIYEDIDGSMYISYSGKLGLCTINENDRLEQIHITVPGSPDPGSINCIFPFNNDVLWLGTNLGLLEWNTSSHRLRYVRIGKARNLISNNVKFIRQNNDKKIWVGSDGIDVIDYPRHSVLHLGMNLKDKNSLSDNNVTCSFTDNQKNLWVGTFSTGLNISYNDLKPFDKYVSAYSELDSISKSIVGIQKDKNGYLWVGTWDRGLVVFDNNNKLYDWGREEEKLAHLKNSVVRTFTSDFEGNIWIGSDKQFLTKISHNKKNINCISIGSNTGVSLSQTMINKILFSSRNKVYVGTAFGGTYLLDTKTGKFDHAKINHSNTLDILEDQNSNIWIATYGDGLYKIDNRNNVLHYQYKLDDLKGISSNKIVTIFEDSENNLWFGTEWGGLCRYDSKNDNFQKFSIKEGLPANDICSILEDRSGCLWIGTNHGLCCFDYNQDSYRNYYTGDGLSSDEFHYNAEYSDNEGILYFGTTNGLVAFSPQEIKEDHFSPPVYIEDIKIFGESININKFSNSEKLKLRYYQNSISFHFAALNYYSVLKNKYSYKLEGVEANWSKPNANLQVSFANLDPGEYKFRVKASNNDGYWYDNESFLSFEILPPPWKTFMAYVLYVLILGLITGFILRFLRQRMIMQHTIKMERLEKQKEKELVQMKLEFFTNISHEFKTPLTLIVGPVEEMIESSSLSEEDRQKLIHVRNNSNRLLKLINQLIHFRKMERSSQQLNLQQDDLIPVVKNVMLSFFEVAQKKSLKLEMKHDADELLFFFDKDKINKILYNLISNALRHTESGYVLVSVEKKETSDGQYNVQIRVKDTGSGISSNDQEKIFDRFYHSGKADNNFQDEGGSTGVGLSYTSDLVQMHKGSIKLNSVMGKGSEFIINLPFHQINFLSTKNPVDETPALLNSESKTMLDRFAVSKKEGPSILIVEDNHELRHYLHGLLNESYQIEDAENGRMGLELARQINPDLVISDIMMPEMNGLEMCNKLKSNLKTSHIPILLLTAKDDVESKILGYEQGANAYLAKPFVPKVLISRIENLLASQQRLREYYRSHPIKREPVEGMNTIDNEFMDKALSIITEKMKDVDFGVEELGNELGLSRVHIYRKFKALSGYTPKEFFKHVQFQRTTELIEEGKLNISEIAYEVGFSSLSTFSSAFKKYFGVSPKEYRRKL